MSVSPEALTKIPVFQRLTPATLRLVARQAMTTSQSRGEIFYQQGELSPGLFALISGYAKLYRHSKDRVQILAVLGPGECFGIESLPDDAPNPCTVTALTETVTIFVALEPLYRLLNQSPDLQEALLELVSSRLAQFVSLVHNLAFRDVTARLAAALMALAQTEGERVAEGICIPRLLSQQELAAFVGTAREVIYRTLKKFEQEHLLRLSPDCILILDSAKLAEIANQETR